MRARVVVVSVVLGVGSVADAEPDVVGIVTSDHTGVANATIRWVGDGRDPVYVTTDRDGKYRVALGPGSWHGSVTAPGQPAQATAVELEGRDAACDVWLPSAGGSYDTIEGVVRAGARPVAGARVDVYGPADASSVGAATATALTDERGHYELVVEHRRGSHRFDVEVRTAGYAPADRTFQTGWDKTGDVELRPGGSIVGSVRGPSGAPVRHARVDITRRTPLLIDDSGPRRTVETDDDGRFALRDLVASTYDVHVADAPDVLVVLAEAEHGSAELVVTRPR
jgi:hypothetical protein